MDGVWRIQSLSNDLCLLMDNLFSFPFVEIITRQKKICYNLISINIMEVNVQLYAILLIVVSFLTTLSGLSVFFGSTRKERSTTIWFFLATICASLWAITIARFLALTTENADLAPKYVAGIFISSVLMDVMLVGYTGWRLRFGKLATITSGILAAVFGWLVITKPELLYSGITIGAGNNIHFINKIFRIILPFHFISSLQL